MRGLPPVLRAKSLGAPRWVWALALTGGVGFGLYLRNRRAARPVSTEDDPSTDSGAVDSGLYGSSGIPASPSMGGGDYSGVWSGAVGGIGFTTSDIETVVNRGIAQYYRDNPIEPAIPGPSYQDVQDIVGGALAGWSPPAIYAEPAAPPDISGGGPPVAPPRSTQTQSPAQQQAEQARRQREAERQAAEQAKRAAEQLISQRVNAAINTPTQKKYRRSRDQIETSARRHPNWGPHTLAKGGRLEGHSEAF